MSRITIEKILETAQKKDEYARKGYLVNHLARATIRKDGARVAELIPYIDLYTLPIKMKENLVETLAHASPPLLHLFLDHFEEKCRMVEIRENIPFLLMNYRSDYPQDIEKRINKLCHMAADCKLFFPVPNPQTILKNESRHALIERLVLEKHISIPIAMKSDSNFFEKYHTKYGLSPKDSPYEKENLAHWIYYLVYNLALLDGKEIEKKSDLSWERLRRVADVLAPLLPEVVKEKQTRNASLVKIILRVLEEDNPQGKKKDILDLLTSKLENARNKIAIVVANQKGLGFIESGNLPNSSEFDVEDRIEITRRALVRNNNHYPISAFRTLFRHLYGKDESEYAFIMRKNIINFIENKTLDVKKFESVLGAFQKHEIKSLLCECLENKYLCHKPAIKIMLKKFAFDDIKDIEVSEEFLPWWSEVTSDLLKKELSSHVSKKPNKTISPRKI